MFQLTNPKEFAFAGNAVITLESENTKNHFTYKIKRADNDPNLYFVNLLHGQDNLNDFSFIGCVYRNTCTFVPRHKYRDVGISYWPPSFRAINFFFSHIDNIPNKLHVYHEGRCGRCGRRLTTPESITCGLGPECRKFGD